MGILFLTGNATAADSEINSCVFSLNFNWFLLIGHTKSLKILACLFEIELLIGLVIDHVIAACLHQFRLVN